MVFIKASEAEKGEKMPKLHELRSKKINVFCVFLMLQVLIITLSFPCIAGAVDGKLSLGIRAGANYPVSAIKDSGLQPFITGGFTAEYGLNDLFSIQTELNYFAISSSILLLVWDSGGDPREAAFNSRFHFIQLPIMARVKIPFTEGKDLSVFGNLGPAVGVQLGGTYNTINYDESVLETNFIRAGLITGIGVEYALSYGGRIYIELRADWNINTFNTSSHLGPLMDPNQTIFGSQLLSATAGYVF